MAFDWGLWGNILFFVGSCMYVCSSVTSYLGVYEDYGIHIDMIAAVVFVIDSLMYLVDWYNNKQEEERDAEQQRLVA